MPDYRKLLERDYLYHYDLDGRDLPVTIRSVVSEEMSTRDGKKSRKGVIYFEEFDRGLVMNASIGDVIAALYGVMTEGWVGKRVTIFPTQDRKGSPKNGSMVDVIRVRPDPPAPAVPPRPPRPQALTALTGEKLKALVPAEIKGVVQRTVRNKPRECVTLNLDAETAGKIGRDAGVVAMIDLTEAEGKTLVLAFEELKTVAEEAKTIADAAAALNAPGAEGTE